MNVIPCVYAHRTIIYIQNGYQFIYMLSSYLCVSVNRDRGYSDELIYLQRNSETDMKINVMIECDKLSRDKDSHARR